MTISGDFSGETMWHLNLHVDDARHTLCHSVSVEYFIFCRRGCLELSLCRTFSTAGHTQVVRFQINWFWPLSFANSYMTQLFK